WINLILFLIVQSRIKQYNFYRNLCFLLFSICILLYKFPIIQERYLYIVNFVTLFFYVDNLKKLKNKFLLIIFILILRLTVTFLTNYPYRSDFIKSYTSLYLYNIILDNRQNINYKELLDNNYGKEIKVKMGEK
ncbi:MAG: hypothetical protein ACRDDH_09365, partial [Cetobacterium sp.]|uniref:hypothetical protein n=1 Tax=Cetobacterium sp. TaxID=2071632 RepID=UPI003EE5A404